MAEIRPLKAGTPRLREFDDGDLIPVEIGGTGVSSIADLSAVLELSGLTPDHGALAGLADDDHPQYVLADGSRTMSTLTVGPGDTSVASLLADSESTFADVVHIEQGVNVSGGATIKNGGINVTGIGDFVSGLQVSNSGSVSKFYDSVDFSGTTVKIANGTYTQFLITNPPCTVLFQGTNLFSTTIFAQDEIIVTNNVYVGKQLNVSGQANFADTVVFDHASSGADIQNAIPTVCITTNTTQDVNTAAGTLVDWIGTSSHGAWGTFYDTNENYYEHDTGTNPERITIKKDGVYRIWCNLVVSSLGQRAAPQIRWRVNGVGQNTPSGVGMSYLRNLNGNTADSIFSEFRKELSANDYVEIVLIAGGLVSSAVLIPELSLFGIDKFN